MTDRIDALLDRARAATRALRRAPAEIRRAALRSVADALEAAEPEVLAENAEDLAAASTGLGAALTDRLRLTPERHRGLVAGVRAVSALPDPLKEERPLGPGAAGIEVYRRRIPLGVLAVIYEARPNVTAECAALGLMSGNAVVLRGGKEARRSNAALGAAIRAGLQRSQLPPDAVAVLAESTREEARALLSAVGRVDLLIPRGGAGLMAMVDAHAKVPVVRHGEGICHLYVDDRASIDTATDILLNAKTQRPGVCNAVETVLVHRAVAEAFLRKAGPRLSAAGVALRADEPARAALAAASVDATAATEADWGTEFLDLILAVRTVGDLDEAMDHVERFGTHHTAAIVTEDAERAERFLAEVDASCVLWNASTRFNDGGALGLGAEMGISTTKMHAYGPMSVRELTAEKFVVRGAGQTRP